MYFSGDGLIDFDEFKHLMYLKMKETDGGDDVKELFTVLDIDKSGYFGAFELQKVIQSLGDNISYEEASELVDSIDTKEHGKVNYDGMIFVSLSNCKFIFMQGKTIVIMLS